MSDIIITLGNVAPHQAPTQRHPGDKGDLGVTLGDANPADMVRLDPIDAHTTTLVVPAGSTLQKAAEDARLLWGHHSYDAPGWLSVTGKGLTKDELGDLEATLRTLLGIPRAKGPVALLTNGGLDFIAAQMAGAASATAVAKYIALTANSTSPAATDTTLTGEIVTASGGLIRAAGTYAHTASASTYTLTNTFTANANDSLPVTIAKAGCFTATSGGTMVFETLLSATATLSAVGDNIPLTWTVTL